ncbi:hypothetical protein DERF_004785 [Dermatophagoides farinae]|uniref:Uncharacterized protein n=1 Tax=Dermatophagoides farinae TaxID=6954 RepID=A0A922L5X5_DERFA|nr:hypothetical protein DERF_004785 [Dermatophagoides farinae]
MSGILFIKDIWRHVELTPVAKNFNGSVVERCLPRERICAAACGGNCPCTTDILTPAFSKTVLSCRIHVMPPPPSCRSQRSE